MPRSRVKTRSNAGLSLPRSSLPFNTTDLAFTQLSLPDSGSLSLNFIRSSPPNKKHVSSPLVSGARKEVVCAATSTACPAPAVLVNDQKQIGKAERRERLRHKDDCPNRKWSESRAVWVGQLRLSAQVCDWGIGVEAAATRALPPRAPCHAGDLFALSGRAFQTEIVRDEDQRSEWTARSHRSTCLQIIPPQPSSALNNQCFFSNTSPNKVSM